MGKPMESPREFHEFPMNSKVHLGWRLIWHDLAMAMKTGMAHEASAQMDGFNGTIPPFWGLQMHSIDFSHSEICGTFTKIYQVQLVMQ